MSDDVSDDRWIRPQETPTVVRQFQERPRLAAIPYELHTQIRAALHGVCRVDNRLGAAEAMIEHRDSLSERERRVYLWLGLVPRLLAIALLAMAFLWLSGTAFIVAIALAVAMLLAGSVFARAHSSDVRIVWNHWPRR